MTQMPNLESLSIKIFADGADRAGMLHMARQPYIRGFTTNPTLMHKAGVRDYEAFARDVLDEITDLPISFEVFSDDFQGMREQAERIASWGDNVYVKIPITNTKRESSVDLIRGLSHEGVSLNVTAIMTVRQVECAARALAGGANAILSVFAGRIADTGRDPIPIMRECLAVIPEGSGMELLWASPREVLNLIQADDIGCHIITMTNDLLAKLGSLGKDLDDFSLDTVRMFHDDARSAGLSI